VPTVTLDYTYDSNGNRTSLTDSLGGSISYSYDGDNQLTSLGLSVSGTLDAQVTMGYDAAGNLTGLMRTAPSVSSDTITSSYSYDQANELTNITDMDVTSNTTLASYTYGYNANGDVSSYQDNSGNSLTYGYDADNQLTSATGSLAGSNYTFTYNYDANGNRTSTSTDINGSLTSATYTTDTGNELTSDGTYDYTYDNDGNMTSQTDIATGSVTYYTWDYENRLTEVKQESSNGTVLNDETFTYDVFGNRIGVSLNGTQQLYTVYDGANPYMDFNGSGTLTERYLTNPNSLNQFYGQVNASGTPEWFLTDNLGSIRQVINTSGSSLDAITYDPYGNIVSQTNSANAPRFLYTGLWYDPMTGTYLAIAREFNPVDGLWESPDPLGLAVDSNSYRYVENSPEDSIDLSGEDGINVAADPGPPVIIRKEVLDVQSRVKLVAGPRGCENVDGKIHHYESVISKFQQRQLIEETYIDVSVNPRWLKTYNEMSNLRVEARQYFEMAAIARQIADLNVYAAKIAAMPGIAGGGLGIFSGKLGKVIFWGGAFASGKWAGSYLAEAKMWERQANDDYAKGTSLQSEANQLERTLQDIPQDLKIVKKTRIYWTEWSTISSTIVNKVWLD